MNGLVSLFAQYLGDQVERSLKHAVSPVAPYLRGLALGTGFLLLSGVALSLALFLLGLAMFTGIAGYGNLVSASLWTALPFALVWALFLSVGLSLLRRPR